LNADDEPASPQKEPDKKISLGPRSRVWEILIAGRNESATSTPTNEGGSMRFFNDESGVTAIEYGLIAALIAIAIIAALTALGDSLSSNFDEIGSNLDGAI
jgi:pilus assembly protein Flp/PilA